MTVVYCWSDWRDIDKVTTIVPFAGRELFRNIVCLAGYRIWRLVERRVKPITNNDISLRKEHNTCLLLKERDKDDHFHLISVRTMIGTIQIYLLIRWYLVLYEGSEMRWKAELKDQLYDEWLTINLIIICDCDCFQYRHGHRDSDDATITIVVLYELRFLINYNEESLSFWPMISITNKYYHRFCLNLVETNIMDKITNYIDNDLLLPIFNPYRILKT